MQQLGVSAINRYNRPLFDLLVGAQQNRWGYGKDAAGHAGSAKVSATFAANAMSSG
jgi:hypothetical protein